MDENNSAVILRRARPDARQLCKVCYLESYDYSELVSRKFEELGVLESFERGVSRSGHDIVSGSLKPCRHGWRHVSVK